MNTKNEVILGSFEDYIAQIPTASVDCVLTDPPYLYLEHRLDKAFDEALLWTEIRRILKPQGFICLFGRGSSFYRWNSALADLGFKFKEEIVWDKTQASNPLNALGRTHELCTIHTHTNGVLNRCKVDYFEQRGGDLKKIGEDIKSLKSALNGKDKFKVMDYLESGLKVYDVVPKEQHSITIKENSYKTQVEGIKQFQTITEGFQEKSIIKVNREHYDTIHPTQKPVRLLERILNLVTKKDDLVMDFFVGSGSTRIACHNLQRNFKGYEIDHDFYSLQNERYLGHISQTKLF